MSGIEVAGLILGAFPVLLGAILKNKEAFELIGDWWKVERLYEASRKNVTAQHDLFQLHLINFLGPILGDGGMINELIANPFSEQWESSSLVASLREHIPTAYESYVYKMQEFYEILLILGELHGIDKQAFQKRVALDKADNKPTPQRAKDLREHLECEWQRIKFGVNKRRRDGMIERLAACNTYLRDFSAASDLTESSWQLRSKRKVGMPRSLTDFWKHARDLYTLIHNAWTCSCCAAHNTSLLLRNHKDPHKVEFKVLFTYAENLTCQHNGPWDWKEIDIVHLSKGNVDTKTPQNNALLKSEGSNVQTIASATQPLGGSKRGKTSKRVAFFDQVVPKANAMALLPLHAQPTLPEITNLCTSLADTVAVNTELGLLTGNSSQFSLFLPDQKAYPKATLEHVTLANVLRKPRQRCLNRRQRYSIALGIASAYVQLHATPWIKPGLDKENIYLLWDSSTGTFYEQPRISRKILSQPSVVGMLHGQSVVKLGIILLELAFNEVLEEKHYRSNRPTLNNRPDLFIDKAAAEEWCMCHAKDECPQFEEPVLWCLHQPVTRTRTSSDDDALRKGLFDNVVQPLAVCCTQNKFDVLEH